MQARHRRAGRIEMVTFHQNTTYEDFVEGTRRGTRRTLVVREHDALTGLDENEQRELERFAFAQTTDADGDWWRVLALRKGVLHAQNCVGVIETRRGTVIEILPKIDLVNVRTRREGPPHASANRRSALPIPRQAGTKRPAGSS